MQKRRATACLEVCYARPVSPTAVETIKLYTRKQNETYLKSCAPQRPPPYGALIESAYGTRELEALRNLASCPPALGARTGQLGVKAAYSEG